MARLINADDFLKRLNERRVDYLDPGCDFYYLEETVESVLAETPTVDAVPAVHGRWEWEPCGDLGHRLVCSVCGGWWAACIENKYCANCGAKMHEEGKNDG